MRTPVLLTTAALAAAMIPATAIASQAQTTGHHHVMRCRAGQLHVRVTDWDGTAGSSYARIKFRNDAAKPCKLKGRPKVQLVGHGNGTPIGASSRKAGAKPHMIVLLPHEQVKSRLELTDPGAIGPRCHITKTDGLRVFAPGSKHSVYVKRAGDGCANKHVKLLHVSPVH